MDQYGILLIEDSVNGPRPFNLEINMWKVNLPPKAIDNAVWIHATDGFLQIVDPCDANQYVYSPNFIERIFGITFEDKINKAIVRCQKWCDKKNKDNKKAKEVIEKIKR